MNDQVADSSSVVRHFSEGDKLAQRLGIELLEGQPGRARARMVVQDYHFNSAGTVHGGAIFSLADFVFAVASNAYGKVALAISVNINFLQKMTEGTLYAEAVEVSRNPKLATYSIRITNEKDELAATFEGMVYITKKEIEF
jgi:acyl-CoA thioesterase